MSVLMGFIIVVMLGLTIYVVKLLFQTKKFYFLLSFCMQLFALTVAISAFVQDVKSADFAELIYVLLGILSPLCCIGINYRKAIFESENYIRFLYFCSKTIQTIVSKIKQRFNKENIEIAKENLMDDPRSLIKEIYPTNLEGYFSLGQNFIKSCFYEEALECFSKCIEQNYKRAESYFQLGIIYDALGNLNEAIFAYKSAIQMKNSMTEAYCNLGSLYTSIGKYDMAIELYLNGIHINPLNYRLYYNMGITLEQIGKYPEAVKAYSMALEQNPYDHEVSFHLGAALTELRKYDEAIKVYKSALDVKPSDSELFYNLSIVYSLLQKPEIAIDSLSKAIALNSEIKMEAKNNSAFKNIKYYPEFKRVIGS